MKMRIHVLSDLHLEREKKTATGYESNFTPPRAAGDVVVLAGDIASSEDVVDWIRGAFDVPVVYVPGNHEFYGTEIMSAKERINAAKFDGIHILNPGAAIVEGVRFIGATLWTDYNLYGSEVQGRLVAGAEIADHKEIEIMRNNERVKFLPNHAQEIHRQELAFIEKALAESFDGPTVVVTHYLPTPDSISIKFEDDKINPSFASDLRRLIDRSQPRLWIHGHTHDSFHYDFADTTIVCNPRGYWGLSPNRNFDIAKTIEIDLAPKPRPSSSF